MDAHSLSQRRIGNASIANGSKLGGEGIATGVDAHSFRQRRIGNASTANGSKTGGEGIATGVNAYSLRQTAGSTHMTGKQRQDHQSYDRHFGHICVR